MTDEEFLEKNRQLMEEERKNPPSWFYLSFMSDDRGSLGCAVVQAQGYVTAVDRSRQLGIHPGDCHVVTMPLDDEFLAKVPTEARETLLSGEDLHRFWAG